MTALPPNFQFSQSNLSDFTNCARRFQLKYLDKLRWPAIESEPVQEAEMLAQQGTDFHRLVQQHLAGLAVDVLEATLPADNLDLAQWWQNYLNHRPDELSYSQIYSELPLSTPLRGYRLFARFDVLVVADDGSLTILDWKTSRHRPPRPALEQRMQSRVYLYVLSKAGVAFNNGQPIDPSTIKMVYWYPHFPDEPEVFAYSQKLQQRDEDFLSETMERIKHTAQTNDFPQVDDTKLCAYCVYRSLCDRGQQAGSLPLVEEALPDTLNLALPDWDQIAEIQF